jgi:hypothetical protein
LLNALTVLSLLFFVAMVVLWVRGRDVKWAWRNNAIWYAVWGELHLEIAGVVFLLTPLLALILTLVVPILNWELYRRRRHADKSLTRLCASCGYDLRAHSGLCRASIFLRATRSPK